MTSVVGKGAHLTHTVPKVSFGRRAGADLHVVSAQKIDVVLAQVNRVHGGEVRVENAFSVQQLRRSAALGCHALLNLCRLLSEMDVQRHAALLRVREDDAH